MFILCQQGISSGVERISSILKILNEFERDQDSQLEFCDIHAILDNALSVVQPLFQGRIEVRKRFTEDSFRIKGNSRKLEHVFLNIITNASQAIAKKGSISITTDLEDPFFHIIIADSGMGIKPEQISHIIDPFYTTREVGEGKGLGLSLAYAIINEHRGTLKIDSKPQVGTTVTIKLPLDIPMV